MAMWPPGAAVAAVPLPDFCQILNHLVGALAGALEIKSDPRGPFA